MARRIPFPFAEHHDPEVLPDQLNDLIPRYIQGYEEALRTEYMSGDIDVASYHEGLREAYEGMLVDLLNIPQAEMDAYWGRTARPVPETVDLPYTGGDPLITYEQVTEWSGKRLDAEQWDALREAIPNSPIPNRVRMLVKQI